MYLRFVSPLQTSARGVNYGIFKAGYKCRDDKHHPKFLRKAIKKEIKWFKKNLEIPYESAFEVHGKHHRVKFAICWFKSDAEEMIEHAFALRALLNECGMFIETIGTYYPGEIRYEDQHQIVARPLKYTPTAWG